MILSILEIFAEAQRQFYRREWRHDVHIHVLAHPEAKARDNATQRARAARNGLCAQCRKREPKESRRLCVHCLDLDRARQKRRAT